MKKIQTKIIATIGPATLDPEIFTQLVAIGVDYIRINTSYGTPEQYDLILKYLKNADPEGRVEVILDIKNNEVLKYARSNEIRYIALSFAEKPEQVERVREELPGAFVISKIESKKGVENFEALLESSDGIMVARGDLGKAIPLEKIPPLQKEFTQKALLQKKFLITATEMLLSMTHNPEPTRAEVSDVANAVFDHSSGVMLSEETAIGKYPVETVIMMRKIIAEAENYNKKIKLFSVNS